MIINSLIFYLNRTWFYFGIKGVERGKYVHFHIKNMNF